MHHIICKENKKQNWSFFFFLGRMPEKNKDIFTNGSIHVLCGILKLVVCSAAEAELAALFLNMRKAKILRLMLEEIGHRQPATPVHCDNSTAVGIANDTCGKTAILHVPENCREPPHNKTFRKAFGEAKAQAQATLAAGTSTCRCTPAQGIV